MRKIPILAGHMSRPRQEASAESSGVLRQTVQTACANLILYIEMNAKNENLSPQGLAALRLRFQEQSRKAQAYYTVMHQARKIAGSDDLASAWMNEPLNPFEGKTPAQLVSEGREEEVLRYIDSLMPGSSG